MAKKEKEKSVVKIDDKDYDVESLTNEQKSIVNHILDLDRKLQSSEFNLIQLRFGKQAFTDALKASLSEASSKDESE
jgi:restriction endonuclease S subunit